MTRCLLILCAVALLPGCRRDTPPGTPMPVDSVFTGSGEVTKPGVLRIEGMEESVTLAEVDVPEAPFTTFVPENTFAVTPTRDAGASDIRFNLQVGGTLVPDTYAAFVFPESVNADSVLADLTSPDGMFSTRGWQRNENTGVSPCLWAAAGIAYRDPANDASGIVCIGTHAGRPFYLVTHYPDHYAEGFNARLDVLLDEFRWRDTGRPLQGE